MVSGGPGTVVAYGTYERKIWEETIGDCAEEAS
jgi:hypothetical protein